MWFFLSRSFFSLNIPVLFRFQKCLPVNQNVFFSSHLHILRQRFGRFFFVSQDVSLKMTELDRLTSLPHMQLVKAALPYIHIPEQRFFPVCEIPRTRKDDAAIC